MAGRRTARAFAAPAQPTWPAAERLEERRLMAAGAPVVAQTNLVSDGPIAAVHTDPNLSNAWGLAFNPAGGLWVSDNRTGLSTIYDQAGNTQPLVVTIPPPTGQSGPAAPTGTVAHAGKRFDVTANGVTAPSQFLFATEDGTISGWTPAVDGTHAVLAVDHSASGAVYKGLALSGSGKGARLYAANFNSGAIEVYDSAFAPVTLPAGAFADTQITAGFAPFNVQAINSKIYVTYARQDAAAHDDVAGVGNGFVDVFSTRGKLIRRLASDGTLNSPWGVAVLPAGWRKFTGDVVVGNFGDGRLNVFNSRGAFQGQLQDASSQPIAIDGLWGLITGTRANKRTLYFSAGPNGESNGLFGTLTVTGLSAASTTVTPPPATGPGY
jgi:uncharacterized protein (TIGR03118 family)